MFGANQIISDGCVKMKMNICQQTDWRSSVSTGWNVNPCIAPEPIKKKKKKTMKDNLKKAKTHLVTNESRVKGSQNLKMTLITRVKIAGVMLVEIKEHLWECLPNFHRSSKFCSGIFWQMRVAHHLILNYSNSIQQQWQLCGTLPQWNSTATKVSAV